MVKSVVSMATLCQFLCTIPVGSFPMSEEGVTMRRILVFACSVH